MGEFIFYHGKGCGHCDAVISFLEEVEKEFDIKFIRKEIEIIGKIEKSLKKIVLRKRFLHFIILKTSK